jgi:DNA-binding NarL/FixJ family response regulator
MAAMQPTLAEAPPASRRMFVVTHEPGTPAEVDHALDAVGADVVGHGTSAATACECRLELAAVVVVTPDVDRRSCETVRALRVHHPESTVVVVVGNVGRGALWAALQAGAGAVVLQADVARALGPALEAAAAGQVSVPQELATTVVRPVLTAREKQILGMLVLGFSNGEIARKLHVAESTVKTHLSRAFPKLGVRSRSEAAAAILDPQTGLGTGILAIPNEPVRAADESGRGA